MALLQLGGGGSSIAGALGNNAITSALGMTPTVMTPLAFVTKFGRASIFASTSLPYMFRSKNDFDLIFHFHPKRSQVRTYMANTFSSASDEEISFYIRSIELPNFVNSPEVRDDGNSRMRGVVPGKGVNGSGELTIEILSTEFSVVDHVFTHWINETESPFWIYSEKPIATTSFNESPFSMSEDSKSCPAIVPFTRADIEIKYYSVNNQELHSVWCWGAFPTSVETMNVDNENKFVTGHKVQFTYDSMTVWSPFRFANSSNSLANAATNAIGSALGGTNSAGWTSGLQEGMLENYLNNSLMKKASRFCNSITNKVGGQIGDALNSAQKAMGV